MMMEHLHDDQELVDKTVRRQPLQRESRKQTSQVYIQYLHLYTVERYQLGFLIIKIDNSFARQRPSNVTHFCTKKATLWLLKP